MKSTGVERLEKKLEKNLGAPGFAWVGAMAISNGEVIKGLDILRQHSAASPHDALAQLALGRAELLDGNYADALACFQETIQIDSCSPGGWAGLLEAAKYLGHDALAQEAREKLQLLDPFFFYRESTPAEEISADVDALLVTGEHEAAAAAEKNLAAAALEEELDDFVLDDIFGDMGAIGNLDVPVTQIGALLDQQEAREEATAVEGAPLAGAREEFAQEKFIAPVSGSDVSLAIDALFGDESDHSAHDQLLESLDTESGSEDLAIDAELEAELGRLLNEDSHKKDLSEEQNSSSDQFELSSVGDDLEDLLTDLVPEGETSPNGGQPQLGEISPVEEVSGEEDSDLSGLDSLFEVDESPQIALSTPQEEPSAPEVVKSEPDLLAAAVEDEFDSLFGEEESSTPVESAAPEAVKSEPDLLADAVEDEFDSLFGEEESSTPVESAAPEAVKSEPDLLADAVEDEFDSLFGEEESSTPVESAAPEAVKSELDSEQSEEIDFLFGSGTEKPSESKLEIVSGAVDVTPASEIEAEEESPGGIFESDFSSHEEDPEPEPKKKKTEEPRASKSEIDDLLADLDEISGIDLDGSSLFGESSSSDREITGLSGGSRLSSTETMAEIYAAQGHYSDALRILQELAVERPDDQALMERIEKMKLRQNEGDNGEGIEF